MDHKKINEPIKRFIRALPKEIRVDRVIVFGSSVTRHRKAESDIDVIVVSGSFKAVSEDQRLDMLYKASQFIEPEIHPWGVTSDELDSASRFSLLGQARDLGEVI